MRKLPILSRLLPLLLPVLLGLTPGLARSQQKSAPSQEPFPGYTAAPATEAFPGVTASPVGSTPLSALPYVYTLKHREPTEMSSEDAAVVAALDPELKKQAALMNFDLSSPGWSYHQIVCPALPDYVLLSFAHGPDPNGSSRFTAALDRSGSRVRVVATFAHGMRPFTAAWSKPATVEIFNQMLRRERGLTSLATAPNWLVIGMCYAELSGYPVEALTAVPDPGPTLDLLRLEANLPQLQIASDRSALVTFSDASKPALTTQWSLSFDRHGQLLSADLNPQRQPARVALRP